ncbi:glycosylhydrolase-like jelly roll fold domain-containing protein [Algibacter sp. PT7-4]|uniref:glycosylhydrolase-like jelly roll fold domain-containing protein n=1 Tax=Algibacter ulvanivorans TaxID=3400999 RepID=UPI003AACF316
MKQQTGLYILRKAGGIHPILLKFSELKSLTQLDNDAIKHYSGTTTYLKTINVNKVSTHTFIDLGKVYTIAEFWCNGKKVGVKWAPPFKFDVSEILKKGENQLQIKVTNTWRNQLIFDNSRSKKNKKTWTTNPPKKDETQLELSGLIGPVILKTVN